MALEELGLSAATYATYEDNNLDASPAVQLAHFHILKRIGVLPHDVGPEMGLHVMLLEAAIAFIDWPYVLRTLAGVQTEGE